MDTPKMPTPDTRDFKQWLYGSMPSEAKSVELRNYLKNHGRWEGTSIDELKVYLDKVGLTRLLNDAFATAIIEYFRWKDGDR
jgi:hypothetical protein